jgi:hypothetical protein
MSTCTEMECKDKILHKMNVQVTLEESEGKAAKGGEVN